MSEKQETKKCFRQVTNQKIHKEAEIEYKYYVAFGIVSYQLTLFEGETGKSKCKRFFKRT